ncbi:hypothetical protein [Carnobacterium maltaromaticum]|uniref:hypothetical protein n=1 Tax=Carnobacterium maltaromaticum TaxID=2751 RepID=UPI00026C88CE|nr:hypothetical protein [Carnobacterium maltaromaticum]
MLPTNDTIIFIFFVLIFCGSMGYYINRVVTYKNDERGISILAKASMITFSSILLLFALFMSYLAVIDMLDLHQTNQLFSLILIRNVVSIIMAFLGIVNLTAIKYFEKHI